MKKLEVSEQAQREIIDIRNYSKANWGVKHANKYTAQMYGTIKILQKNPRAGLTHTDLPKNIFYFPYASHIIYYTFNEETLYLMAVLHKNMLPKNHLQGDIK